MLAETSATASLHRLDVQLGNDFARDERRFDFYESRVRERNRGMRGAISHGLRAMLVESLAESRQRLLGISHRESPAGPQITRERLLALARSGGIGQLSMSQIARSSSPSSTDTADIRTDTRGTSVDKRGPKLWGDLCQLTEGGVQLPDAARFSRQQLHRHVAQVF